MNDEKFKKALLDSFEHECNRIESIDVPKYQTSEQFQFKMNKILQKSHKAGRVTSRFAAACAITFFALGTFVSFTAYAASPTLRSFIISIFDGEQKISVTDSEKAPEVILTRYFPTAIPDDYRITEIPSGTNNSLMIMCVNGDDQIFFGQYIKSIYNQIDIGTDCFEYYTDESGQEYMIAQLDDGYLIIWDNGEYVLHIYSTLSKEESISLCLSVEPIAE